MKDFRSFLRDSYSLKRVNAIKLREEGEDENNKNKNQQPRLLILSRRRTRSFTNTAEIAKMARSMGFDEAHRNGSWWKHVKLCKCVLIQVVPHGGFQWLTKYDFELPSKDMGLKFKSVHLEQQNVMLDLNRFRPTLLQKALELLQQ
ncbi:uncharacterized protein DS421_14g448940 [Arachis hypogaea]|nr:uncharacterized protein DS421_14g448940 [Arachis hypogaea]